MSLYFVETTAAEQRELLCRWTERFYGQKRKVQIVVDSTPAAQFIDQLVKGDFAGAESDGEFGGKTSDGVED